MHLRRYRSETVRDALAQARTDLGPGALVLSTRLVSDRSWRGWLGHRVVEVTAAANRDMSESRPTEPPPRQSAQALTGPEARVAVDRAALVHHEAVVARLCAAGVDQVLATDVARALPRSRRRELPASLLRHAVADQLQAIAAGDVGFARADVFIGPPGVGKTTTIAKIAAQERARRGHRLSLLAADGFRVGAVEQLRLYADIIGAPFTVARSMPELEQALNDCGSGPVLVDTAGRSVREPQSAELLELLGRRADLRTHLVLAAGTTPRDAARLLQAYGPARPACVALTRVDEAESLGPIIGLLRERGVRVSFLGVGQHVPDDLERATPGVLAARLLGDEPAETGART